MLITVLAVVLALAGCMAFFALSVCWLANQEESLKGEDDYSKANATEVEDDDRNEK